MWRSLIKLLTWSPKVVMISVRLCRKPLISMALEFPVVCLKKVLAAYQVKTTKIYNWMWNGCGIFCQAATICYATVACKTHCAAEQTMSWLRWRHKQLCLHIRCKPSLHLSISFSERCLLIPASSQTYLCQSCCENLVVCGIYHSVAPILCTGMDKEALSYHNFTNFLYAKLSDERCK